MKKNTIEMVKKALLPLVFMAFASCVSSAPAPQFGKPQSAPSWFEQEGDAMVQGRKIHYMLTDTVSYHGGKADPIYNRYIPKWVEEMNYVIDYDNIEEYNPNPNLASSVKALMWQRVCDVSVALVRDQPGYDYVVINEQVKSGDVYKTTVYPLFNQTINVAFNYWGFPSNEGVVDLGAMSKTAASQRMEKEFDDLFNKYGSRYSYGDYLKLNEDTINGIFAFIKRPQEGRLYKVWYQAASYSFIGSDYIGSFLGYIWCGDNGTYTYMIYEVAQ